MAWKREYKRRRCEMVRENKMAQLKDPFLTRYMRRLIWSALTALVIALILLVTNGILNTYNTNTNKSNINTDFHTINTVETTITPTKLLTNIETIEQDVKEYSRTPTLAKLIRTNNDFNKNSVSVVEQPAADWVHDRNSDDKNKYNASVEMEDFNKNDDNNELHIITNSNNVFKFEFDKLNNNTSTQVTNFNKLYPSNTIKPAPLNNVKTANKFSTFTGPTKPSESANTMKAQSLPPSLLDRRKRYLVFPESSSFQLSE